jgi:hypothetical protein
MQLKFKRSLGEQEISDLFSDELSEVPCVTSSDSDTDSDTDSGSDSGQQTIVAIGSKSESSDENECSNIAGTTTWGKVDKTPTLGQFTGNSGVKQIPSDSDTDLVRPGPSTPTPGRPHVNTPGRLSG